MRKYEYHGKQWHEECFLCRECRQPIGSRSFIPRDQEVCCVPCYEEKYAQKCRKCTQVIKRGGVTYKGEPYHKECLVCTNCNTQLAGLKFTSKEDKPYCADCYGQLFAKKCCRCSQAITGFGGCKFISFEERHWHSDCFVCYKCSVNLVGKGFLTDGDDILCPDGIDDMDDKPEGPEGGGGTEDSPTEGPEGGGGTEDSPTEGPEGGGGTEESPTEGPEGGGGTEDSPTEGPEGRTAVPKTFQLKDLKGDGTEDSLKLKDGKEGGGTEDSPIEGSEGRAADESELSHLDLEIVLHLCVAIIGIQIAIQSRAGVLHIGVQFSVQGLLVGCGPAASATTAATATSTTAATAAASTLTAAATAEAATAAAGSGAESQSRISRRAAAASSTWPAAAASSEIGGNCGPVQAAQPGSQDESELSHLDLEIVLHLCVAIIGIQIAIQSRAGVLHIGVQFSVQGLLVGCGPAASATTAATATSTTAATAAASTLTAAATAEAATAAAGSGAESQSRISRRAAAASSTWPAAAASSEIGGNCGPVQAAQPGS
uniref:LIM zinc-binding domain-containing protein n=1 Tax=Macrostomum lignano TaxID=282301 RepID=A0A1I8IRH5_9PLAT